MDIIVEDATSDPPASKTTCKVSVISDASDHSLNALHTFSSPVYASHIDSGAKADSLDAAAFKISIDTASAVPGEDNQAWNASHVSTSSSLIVFSESTPACIEGRLIPSPILFWLRSRLATEGEYLAPPGGGEYQPRIHLLTSSIGSVVVIGSSTCGPWTYWTLSNWSRAFVNINYIEVIVSSPCFHSRQTFGKSSSNATTSIGSLNASKLVTTLSKSSFVRAILLDTSSTFETPLSLAWEFESDSLRELRSLSSP